MFIQADPLARTPLAWVREVLSVFKLRIGFMIMLPVVIGVPRAARIVWLSAVALTPNGNGCIFCFAGATGLASASRHGGSLVAISRSRA
jgi:hypothetical protein